MGSLLSVIVRQTTSRHVVLRPCAGLDRGDDRKASGSKKNRRQASGKRAAARYRALPLVGLDRFTTKKTSALLTTSRMSGEQPDDMRTASRQGAISRRYPVVLSRRSRGSELMFSTEAESADKASGSKKNPPSGGIKNYLTHVGLKSPTICAQPAGAKKSAVRRNHLPRQRLPHACCAFSATTGAQPAAQGAISRRYPVVLPRSRDRSVLAYVTGAATTARPAGASKIAPLFLKHEINGAHHA